MSETEKITSQKDKMKTNPYGIEDKKIKEEKLMGQKEKEKLKKTLGIGFLASPPKDKKVIKRNFNKGGRVNLKGGGCAKRGLKKNAYGKNS
jgi:hypothetical protein